MTLNLGGQVSHKWRYKMVTRIPKPDNLSKPMTYCYLATVNKATRNSAHCQGFFLYGMATLQSVRSVGLFWPAPDYFWFFFLTLVLKSATHIILNYMWDQKCSWIRDLTAVPPKRQTQGYEYIFQINYKHS